MAAHGGNQRGDDAGQWRARVGAAFVAEQDRWFLWTPVALGAGAACYFALPREPYLIALIVLFGVLLVAAWCARGHAAAGALLAFAALVALGLTLAKARTELVAAPVLQETRYSAQVTGWVEETERRADGRLRLTVRIAAIARLEGDETPRRALVTLRQDAAPGRYPPGTPVRFAAYLQPPPEPAVPGGYDFARASWFRMIGAVGAAHRLPSLWQDAPRPPLRLRAAAAIERMRIAVAARIKAGLDGDAGIIAAALITGLRGDIPQAALQALRASGLAHVLAISGLHMTLMAGALFWLVRAGLAAIPALAIAWPIKRIAAAVALAGATYYLVLSGASVATQRAWVMIAIMLVAVLLQRAALTMRNVALAAIAVIAITPESVLTASFQMSFAAAVALVAAYEFRLARTALREERGRAGQSLPVRLASGLAFYFAAIAFTTIVASTATAPFAAYHFHRLAPFSLLGNVLAMPAFGLLVMPAGLVSAIAIPFGLEPVTLQIMGLGIDWVLFAARLVADLPGAETPVTQLSALGLGLMVTGFLWLVIWRRPWRLAGLAGLAAGIGFGFVSAGPDVLIDRSAANVAVRDGAILSVLTRRPDGFTVDRWLERDGDGRGPDDINGAAFSCDDLACIAPLAGGGYIAIVSHRAALDEECGAARIVVTKFPLHRPCTGPELVLDATALETHGAHALWLGKRLRRMETARPLPGARPWAGHMPPAMEEETPEEDETPRADTPET